MSDGPLVRDQASVVVSMLNTVWGKPDITFETDDELETVTFRRAALAFTASYRYALASRGNGTRLIARVRDELIFDPMVDNRIGRLTGRLIALEHEVARLRAAVYGTEVHSE